MHVLLVSQMYPGPDDPDLGAFVAQMEAALRDRGHEVDLAVLDRRAGGKRRFLELRRQVRAARRPDVVWAHFLFPTGWIASSVDAPLVVTAHGRDVRNIGAIPGVAAMTRKVVRRATTVIAVSDYLRRELEAKLPEARGKTEVIDSGVDLERFKPAPRLRRARRSRTAAVRVPRRPQRAQERRPARGRLRDARPREPDLRRRRPAPERPRGPAARLHITGRVPHDEVPRYLAAADVVCSPSLIEPFGQAILEAMACGRTVVATRIGGPPEFVVPEAGILVDPLDTRRACRARSQRAAGFPRPNEARPGPPPRATTSGFRRSGWRRSSCEPFEIGEPDLDERPDPLLEAGGARELERLLVARADLLRRDAVLEPVVTCEKQFLDPLARRRVLHARSVRLLWCGF